MQRFSIQATSATAGYTVKRTNTEDGSDSVFKNLMQAQAQAEQWVTLLNEETFANCTDWVVQVDKT